MAKKPVAAKAIEALRHDGDKRLNIPSAEHHSVLGREDKAAKTLRYRP